MTEQKEIRRDDRYATREKYASLRGVHMVARQNLSDTVWNYMQCGTGDEVTARANISAFDDYLFEAPLFAGVANPDTCTKVLGYDLAFPALTAPFGGGETLFHPDGMLAVGRAADASGIRQMVPVAAAHSLEEVRVASPAAVIFQMTFCGDENQVIDMMHRAKNAGYEYICVTYSPIRQWRERMMEDRFSMPGAGTPANFGPGKSDQAMMRELLDFSKPRWDWAAAERVIRQSPLPCIIKGVTSRSNARAALKAGAQGLYVSNYGGRTLDREPAAITTLAEVRNEAGRDIPIIFDSGIRRGSDIATALALGADAVALGRACALGLAADGEAGVKRVLDLLKDEFWTTLGHLGCSTVNDLSPEVFRARP